MNEVSLSSIGVLEEEIYENQRAWLGKGFSSKGLLPTERKNYSTEDGSISWKTIDEGATDLLIEGWEYDEQSREFFCKALIGDGILTEGGDLDGWRYSKDFSNEARENAGRTRRKAIHWVRFRKLVRMKYFNPENFLPKLIYDKCDHGDSQVIKEISEKMVDALTYATMGKSSSNLVLSTVLPLKKKLIKSLDISRKLGFSQDSFSAILEVHQDIQRFAETEKKDRLFSKNNYEFNTRYQDPAFKRRRDLISSRYMQDKEVRPYVNLLIRSIDHENFQLHCDEANCGKKCIFCPEPCPNVGCTEVMSRKHLEKHNETCEFFVLECKCGEKLPRKSLAMHLMDACPLRTVECPFHKVGCLKVVTAQDLEAHLEKDVNSHLLLAMNRMLEHQTVIQKMNSQILLLEKENSELKSLVPLHHKEHKEESKDLKKDLKSLTKKFSRLESTANMEFKRMRARSRERN